MAIGDRAGAGTEAIDHALGAGRDHDHVGVEQQLVEAGGVDDRCPDRPDVRCEALHTAFHDREEPGKARDHPEAGERIDTGERAAGLLGGNEADRGDRGGRQQRRDIASTVGQRDHQISALAELAHLSLAPQRVDGRRHHGDQTTEALRHRVGVVPGRLGEQADEHHLTLGAVGAAPPGEPGRDHRGELAGAEPERARLVDHAIHAPPQIGEPRIGPGGRAAVLGHERAEPGTRLDQAAVPQLAIDLAHGHGGDAQLLGQLTNRRQPGARSQLAAGDAVLDHAAQLHAQRHRQITVDGQPHRGARQLRRNDRPARSRPLLALPSQSSVD